MNVLLKLIDQQDKDDYEILLIKIYLYVKDPYEPKYQYLINKHEKIGPDSF